MLSADQIKSYQENGYVLVKGLFSKEEAAELRSEVHGIAEELRGRHGVGALRILEVQEIGHPLALELVAHLLGLVAVEVLGPLEDHQPGHLHEALHALARDARPDPGVGGVDADDRHRPREMSAWASIT